MLSPTPISVTSTGFYNSFSVWLETPFGGLICNLFYIIFTITTVLVFFSLAYKVKLLRTFIDKVITTFAKHCFTDVATSSIESFSQKLPDIICRKIDDGVSSLIKLISESFSGKTIKIDNLTIVPAHMDAQIYTSKDPRVLYEQVFPKEVINQIPELKDIEELFKDAKTNYEKIIQKCNLGSEKYLDSNNRYYFNILKARALITNKNYTIALQELNKAKELCSTDSDIYFYIGKCQRHLKDFKGAESNLKKAISINKKESKYFIELDLLYWEMDDIDAAIKAAKRAHDIYEQEGVDKNSHAYLELHNQLEFYYCLKFDRTEDRQYLEFAQKINDWFENDINSEALKEELDRGFLNDTMGYFYFLKSTSEENPERKKEYIKKAYELQSKAAEKVLDADVVGRLLRIIEPMS